MTIMTAQEQRKIETLCLTIKPTDYFEEADFLGRWSIEGYGNDFVYLSADNDPFNNIGEQLPKYLLIVDRQTLKIVDKERRKNEYYQM